MLFFLNISCILQKTKLYDGTSSCALLMTRCVSYTDVWFSMRMRQVEEEELTVKLQMAGLLLRQQMLSSAFLLRNLNYSVRKKKKGKSADAGEALEL
jgi:hypothetical protein